MRERLLGHRADFTYLQGHGLKFPLFKFLHSRDIEYWNSGSIKINTLYSYAKNDSVGGMADPNEIKVESRKLQIDEARNPRMQRYIQNLKALGIANIGSGAANLTIGSGQTFRANRHIMCFSNCFSKSAFEKWNTIEGYDACIEITDGIKFLRTLQSALINNENIPIRQGFAAVDDVVYENWPYDLDVCDFSYFSFHKDKNQFSWQTETRVSWPAKLSREDNDPVFVTIPNGSSHFRRIA